MNTPLRTLTGLLLVAGLVALPASGQTEITLEPSKDNTLYENAGGDLSNGSGIHLFAGRTNQSTGSIRRAIMAFDLTDVPAGATVDSVKLTMTMSKTISGDHPADLHRLTRDWGEGTSDAAGQEGSGAPASSGDATWTHAFFDSQTWSSAGGDFEVSPSASSTVGGVGTYTWGSSAGMVADVQGWVDDASSNFGWILIGDESTPATAKRYGSRENNSPPQLQVWYSTSTAVDDAPETPAAVALLSSYPNPFTDATTIEYSVSEARQVRLEVYDTLGRRITTLVDGFHAPGRYDADFRADGLPTGVYFYRLESEGDSRYRQVVLIR